MHSYACATCQKRCQFDGKPPTVYPFCGERCKMADLGKWFRDAYVLERDLTPEELAGHHAQGGGNDANGQH